MAFHPYPRVVPSVFNRSGFGPPRGLTPASACPWIDRPASRPRRATHAPLEARFRCGSFPNLTSPHAATRWLILQKARRHPARGLRLLAGARFQALFHSPLGVLFTFPSRYWFAIGHRRVFSLGGRSPLLQSGFHVPGLTRDGDPQALPFRVRGSHPVPPAFPGRSATTKLSDCSPGIGPWDVAPRDPRAATPLRLSACTGLGWPGFARRYSRDLG